MTFYTEIVTKMTFYAKRCDKWQNMQKFAGNQKNAKYAGNVKKRDFLYKKAIAYF